MLFISSGKSGSRLADVAADVFRALGVSVSGERLSAHYPPDGHYFAGYALNASCQVYDGDSDQMLDFPFRLSVGKPISWGKGVDVIETEPQPMAKLLAAAGFRVFVPHGDWWSIDWDGDGELYTP